MKLRHRIRNEVGDNSYFTHKLRKLGMDRSEQIKLSIKVASVEQGIDFSETPEKRFLTVLYTFFIFSLLHSLHLQTKLESF